MEFLNDPLGYSGRVKRATEIQMQLKSAEKTPVLRAQTGLRGAT
jgi:hypothetical protein